MQQRNFFYVLNTSLIILLGSIFSNQVDAQESKPTQDDQDKPTALIDYGMIDGPRSLLADLPDAPSWHSKTAKYIMKKGGQDFLVDPESGEFEGEVKESQKPEGLDDAIQSALSSAKIKFRERRIGVFTKPNRRILSSKTNRFQIYSSFGIQILFDAESKSAQVLKGSDPETELFQFSAEEDMLFFVIDNILHVMNLETGDLINLREAWQTLQKAGKLQNGQRDLHVFDHWGKLDWVYQEELYGRGNFKGFWYDADTRQLAVLLLNETEVDKYTIVDRIPTLGRSEITAYPKAGEPIPQAALIWYQFPEVEKQNRDAQAPPASSVAPVIAQIDPVDAKTASLISNVAWTGQGSLTAQIQNREQTKMTLVQYDRTDDSNEPVTQRTLISEETGAWIESYGTPHLFEDDSFLWLSPVGGFTHLYHYNSDGQLRKALTSGDWEIRELLGVDPAGKFAYFTAAKEDAINLHGFRVDIQSGTLEQITSGPGTHSLDFCEDYSFFIDTVSTFTTPSKSFVCRNDGTQIREIENEVDTVLSKLNISEPEFLEVPVNGNMLDAVIIRPPDFDPAKKYPVLYHIYAGPQAPRVRNRFMGKSYLWHQMLAQKGYVIWMCDNRSASFRGKKGMWETHRTLGKFEMADIQGSVDWLKQQSWVDQERIGIWGWSYGGYMTAYALTHSKSFKMGISGAPVTDWRNYDAIYTERLMGLPQDNPKGYTESSILPVAKNLHGKLLLIHGTMDDNVHISNSMQFIYQLQKANKQFDFMVYPKNRHSVQRREQVGHMRRLMTNFILENL